jgi:predicted amidohydrolase
MAIRVAGVQMEVTEDVGQNVATICRAIEQARSAQAGILLTPEGSLSGYTPDFDPAQVTEALQEVTSSARQLGVGLALGTCFREPDGRVYNQLRFYTSDGAYLGFHSKILCCGSMGEKVEGEVTRYASSELRVFSYRGITVGGLICNDMWANPGCTPMPDPHLSQQLSRKGARIIFHAVNGGRDGSPWSREVVWNYHESNLRMRAQAGRVWIVTVDNCHPSTIPCASPGGVIDPDGRWVCRTEPQGEQFVAHAIELAG